MPKKGGKKKGADPEKEAADAAMMAKAREIQAENERKEQAAAEAAKAKELEKYAALVAKYSDLGMSETDIVEYKEMFDLVDSDGGGTIGREEVIELMRTVGYDCTEEEVDDMINEIDTDGNGDIDFDEFITMMFRKPEALRHPEEIRAAFKLFEKDLDDAPGMVRKSALVHALTNLCAEKLSRSEANDLLAQLPKEDDRGLINYADYIAMMAQ
eukprot:SAG22_NODE_1071_length_5708_cov_8.431093_2_plen_213_part_00